MVRFLKRASAVVAISVGSMVAFSLLLTPKRLAGATSSAKLKWQQRQREMQQSAAPAHRDSTAPAADAANPAEPPANP